MATGERKDNQNMRENNVIYKPDIYLPFEENIPGPNNTIDFGKLKMLCGTEIMRARAHPINVAAFNVANKNAIDDKLDRVRAAFDSEEYPPRQQP